MAKRMMLDNEQSTAANNVQEHSDGNVAVENKAVQQLVNENIAAVGAPEDKYAHMFADWDLLPPQILIRRVKRK